MCGRIRQAELADEYFATIFPDMRGLFTLERPKATENVPPGSEPLVIHQLTGEPIITHWHWLYRPAWAGKGRPYPNARFDTALSGSRWWAGPLKHGRMIIPADGWYEWTGEKPDSSLGISGRMTANLYGWQRCPAGARIYPGMNQALPLALRL